MTARDVAPSCDVGATATPDARTSTNDSVPQKQGGAPVRPWVRQADPPKPWRIHSEPSAGNCAKRRGSRTQASQAIVFDGAAVLAIVDRRKCRQDDLLTAAFNLRLQLQASGQVWAKRQNSNFKRCRRTINKSSMSLLVCTGSCGVLACDWAGRHLCLYVYFYGRQF